jgi:membrane fusion protein, multidrug efflux system
LTISNDESPQGSTTNGDRRRTLSIIAAIFVGLGIIWAIFWVLVFSQRERTDDAYINGNRVTISAQVTGTVIAVLADNTELVTAGQVLVRLDSTDSETNLARAEAALARRVREVRQQVALSSQYDSLIASRRLELARAAADAAKREPLIADNAIAPEELRHAREAVQMARASLAQALRQASAAHVLVDGTDVRGNPVVREAAASYRDAWLALHRAAIIAPVTGYVAERSTELGQRIQPGQTLMTVIPLHSLWLDANFKESQLQHLRIGQPVEIRTDVYGGDALFHGRVAGVAAGTGAAFSLLPPQNASGNWIKVVQRVPVRITLDPKELQKHPLRIGLSATATADTHDRGGEVLAASPAGVTSDTAVYSKESAAANLAAEAIVSANLVSANLAHGQ